MNDSFSDLLSRLNNSNRLSSQWESTLRKWAKPPSQTEQDKCDRAVRMVQEAIDSDPKLSGMNITVFAKGSYRNRTNIPSDSDVDVGVRANDYFLNDYPEGISNSDVGFVSSPYTFAQFKEDVAAAIISKFGRSEVLVSDKSIKVRSNSCRVDADVVPHFVHQRYSKDKTYISGVALKTRSGKVIYNWPDQDYENGVAKNERTAKRYKAMVRIVKNLRCEMVEDSYESAEDIQSYLIACLIWNVPDDLLDGEDYSTTLRGSLEFLRESVSNFSSISNWGEVNELKYLFRDSQPWNIESVYSFLTDALSYIGEKED